MKKLFALLSLTVALAGTASAAPYATYTDVNPADVRLDANSFLNPFYNPSYTGNFTLAGYNAALEEIVSANISFLLWDSILLGGSEAYAITLSIDNLAFQSGGSFTGFLSFNENIYGAALLNLSDTGALSYTVTATSGSFWLKEATIIAESALRVTGQPHSVPETSTTFALMGAALLGLAAVRRKVRA